MLALAELKLEPLSFSLLFLFFFFPFLFLKLSVGDKTKTNEAKKGDYLSGYLPTSKYIKRLVSSHYSYIPSDGFIFS